MNTALCDLRYAAP